jgi:hypothetical protein
MSTLPGVARHVALQSNLLHPVRFVIAAAADLGGGRANEHNCPHGGAPPRGSSCPEVLAKQETAGRLLSSARSAAASTRRTCPQL